MQASLFLIVTLMPAPLPSIKSQAQSIWRAHHMSVVPQHILSVDNFIKKTVRKFFTVKGKT